MPSCSPRTPTSATAHRPYAPSAEALLLGLVGGLADLAFRFTLTPSILAKTIAFALAMALIGGFLPAVRAARLEIVDALRAS